MNTKNDKLLKLIHSVTGTKWDWYWGDKALLGCEGEWQLMPDDEAKVDGFWDWHLTNSRQWFDSKHEATTALLSAWFLFPEINLAMLKRFRMVEDVTHNTP